MEIDTMAKGYGRMKEDLKDTIDEKLRRQQMRELYRRFETRDIEDISVIMDGNNEG